MQNLYFTQTRMTIMDLQTGIVFIEIAVANARRLAFKQIVFYLREQSVLTAGFIDINIAT